MEKWQEIFEGVIPIGKYLAEVRNGEEEGLVILLENIEYSVKIDFGAVSAIRIFDEGILLQGTFEESELAKYKRDNFTNTIYKLSGGEFENSVRKMSGEIYDILNLEHYLIITLNYVIEVISRWKPEISVILLNRV